MKSIVSKCKQHIHKILCDISEHFGYFDKGALEQFLGREITRQGVLGPISSGHMKYVKQLLHNTDVVHNCINTTKCCFMKGLVKMKNVKKLMKQNIKNLWEP